MSDNNLIDDVVDGLTLYFILWDKSYLDRASKVIDEHFKRIKEGDATEAIFNWFKKFRGNYKSERNAVEREFLRWYEVNK